MSRSVSNAIVHCHSQENTVKNAHTVSPVKIAKSKSLRVEAMLTDLAFQAPISFVTITTILSKSFVTLIKIQVSHGLWYNPIVYNMRAIMV